MKREDIIEKIKKLLAMSTDKGASENEALQAALMAQRYIADYDVQDVELYAEELDEIEDFQAAYTRRRWAFEILSHIVAQNFRCKSFLRAVYPIGEDGEPEYYRNSKTHAVFYGYKHDAEAAAMVYEHLYKVGNKLANEYAREALKTGGCSRNYYYENYVRGFLKGVKSELEKQCQALMLVVPSEVKDEFAKRTAGFSTRATHGLYSGENAAINAGTHAGADAVRSRRMGQPSGKALCA